MKLTDVKRVLLLRSIDIKNSCVSKNFLDNNYNACLNHCDCLLMEYCKVGLERPYNSLYYCIQVLLFLIGLSFYLFLNNLLLAFMLSFFLCLNFDFVYTGCFKNFVCRIILSRVFKIKIYRKNLDPNGYDFVFVGQNPSDDKCIVISSAIKPGGVKIKDMKMYLTSSNAYYSVVFDYVNGAKNSLHLDSFCNKLYSELSLEVDTVNFIYSQ